MLELILSDESDTLKMGAAIMHAINQIESEDSRSAPQWKLRCRQNNLGSWEFFKAQDGKVQ